MSHQPGDRSNVRNRYRRTANERDRAPNFAFSDVAAQSNRTRDLGGRRYRFDGAYQVAFYTHLLVGPVLLLTMAGVWISGRRWERSTQSRWHQRVGRVQVWPTLMLLVSTVAVGCDDDKTAVVDPVEAEFGDEASYRACDEETLSNPEPIPAPEDSN